MQGGLGFGFDLGVFSPLHFPGKAFESTLIFLADFLSESTLFVLNPTGLMFLISFRFLFLPLNSHLYLFCSDLLSPHPHPFCLLGPLMSF